MGAMLRRRRVVFVIIRAASCHGIRARDLRADGQSRPAPLTVSTRTDDDVRTATDDVDGLAGRCRRVPRWRILRPRIERAIPPRVAASPNGPTGASGRAHWYRHRDHDAEMMPPKSREFRRIERRILGPAMRGLGFRRPPVSGSAAGRAENPMVGWSSGHSFGRGTTATRPRAIASRPSFSAVRSLSLAPASGVAATTTCSIETRN